jgi:hypothetical protein
MSILGRRTPRRSRQSPAGPFHILCCVCPSHPVSSANPLARCPAWPMGCPRPGRRFCIKWSRFPGHGRAAGQSSASVRSWPGVVTLQWAGVLLCRGRTRRGRAVHRQGRWRPRPGHRRATGGLSCGQGVPWRDDGGHAAVGQGEFCHGLGPAARPPPGARSVWIAWRSATTRHLSRPAALRAARLVAGRASAMSSGAGPGLSRYQAEGEM